MPTTTNFGWTTPADTDLVKDGAAAIRTLAGNIDTSLVDLKGGTTGQFLSKNSNTDLDFVFATPSAGGMTLINTGGTTLTGASVTVGSIPGTYQSLRVIIQNSRTVSDSNDPVVRINGDSTANRHLRCDANTGTAAFNDTGWRLVNSQDNGTSNSLIHLEIPDYTNTTTWKTGYGFGVANRDTTPTEATFRHIMFVYNQTGAITSLQFVGDPDGWTSGTVYVYGVK